MNRPSSYNQTEIGYRVEARTRHGASPVTLKGDKSDLIVSENWREIPMDYPRSVDWGHLWRHKLLSLEYANAFAWRIAAISWSIECRLVQYEVHTEATCTHKGSLAERIAQQDTAPAVETEPTTEGEQAS